MSRPRATPSRRPEIVACAARMFSSRGVAATTVRDIADEVGLHSGSLYHYFGSKDELVSEILIAFLDDLTCSYASEIRWSVAAPEQLRDLIHVSLRVAVRHPHASEIYDKEFGVLPTLPGYRHIDARVLEAQDVWSRILANGIAENSFRRDFESAQLQRLLREIVWTATRWHRDSLDADHVMLSTTLVDLFVDGITARAPGSPAPAAAAVRADPFRERGAGDEIGQLRREVQALRGVVEELRVSSA
ncbi:TetR/AcrR family transcriptional regulator [Prescottella equi]|uniref:TetR/AcrR family transcriptional regulator n=1 Tax=Rhodococcus hoagii TaxID=43767 RepID=UPI0025764A1C|nr:TetR/AcrR family transcriptional regulator [Prescottella equi]WJJ12218.1 TetR/AcrR family transcriptional regulator [Prescottella equi]